MPARNEQALADRFPIRYQGDGKVKGFVVYGYHAINSNGHTYHGEGTKKSEIMRSARLFREKDGCAVVIYKTTKEQIKLVD